MNRAFVGRDQSGASVHTESVEGGGGPQLCLFQSGHTVLSELQLSQSVQPRRRRL